jgi:hypothetical protein
LGKEVVRLGGVGNCLRITVILAVMKLRVLLPACWIDDDDDDDNVKVKVKVNLSMYFE